MALAWYAYTGGPVNNVNSYALLQGQPLGCLNGTILCAILAPAGGPIPAAIPPGLLADINTGLMTGLAQPNPRPPLIVEVLLRN